MALARAPEDVVLESVHWERIQLVLRFRGETPRLGLLDGDGASEAMPATRQWVQDGETFARFNVMLGPGRQPLAHGTWQLVTLGGAGPERLAVVAGADLPAELPARLYALGRRTLAIEPAFDAARGTLAVRVVVEQVDELVGRKAGRPPKQPRGRLATLVGRGRRKLGKPGFRMMVRVMRVLSLGRRGRILFVTRLSPVLTGNLKAVHDRMVERGLDRRYTLVSILKPDLVQRLGVMDQLRLIRGLATADAIFLDDSFMPVFWVAFPPEVRVIQLWHAAGAFKTVGYSRAGAEQDDDVSPFLNPYGVIHKSYTHAIVSSDFDVPFYAEAFGLPEERVVPTGIPRMDRFFRPEAKVAAEAEALATFPAIEGRAVWLFAPTYRADTVAEAYYDEDRIDYAALHALAVERNAVVIFKMHPFVRRALTIPEAFADRLIDATRTRMDVNDLLFVVDLLITDYSSIIFEYSVLNRPMLFFAYDLEEYRRGRELYVPFEELVPGRIVHTFDELLAAIRREDYELEKVAAFANRHFAHLDGGSTDRVIDLAIGR